MKKLVIAMIVLAAVIPMVFASGNGERQTVIEGIAVITENANGTKNLAIQAQEGKLVQVEISAGDLERLQIRD